MTTDMAELQPDYLAYLKRTGHVPSESRLTFLDNSLPFSDLGNVGCYYPLSGRRNTYCCLLSATTFLYILT